MVSLHLYFDCGRQRLDLYEKEKRERKREDGEKKMKRLGKV